MLSMPWIYSSKIKVLAVLLTVSSFSFCQNNNNKHIVIQGEVTNGNPSDSIYFNTDAIKPKYYEQKSMSSAVNNGKFKIILNRMTYPQMYSCVFLSDTNKYAWRSGVYFIDSTTTYINIDHNSTECSASDGITSDEFHTKFIPFLFKDKKYDCNASDFENYRWSKDGSFDSLLYQYVLNNRNSYVGLWLLADRVNFDGQTAIRQKALELFSPELKKSSPWIKLNEDVNTALVKEGEKFPQFQLKDTSLSDVQLNLKKDAKFTLIVFWFSRCKPCMAEIPTLDTLYKKWHSKGLDIISISTDKDVETTLWEKRLATFKMPWRQYEDLNAQMTKQIPIIEFPSNYLVDKNGIVLKRNYDIDAIGNLFSSR